VKARRGDNMAEIIFKTDNPEGVTELVKNAIFSEICRERKQPKTCQKAAGLF
jgi:hypothetical protein